MGRIGHAKGGSACRGDGLTISLPGRAVQPKIGLLEGNEVTVLIQVVLKFGDVALLAVVTL
jgi:hypothetical protein